VAFAPGVVAAVAFGVVIRALIAAINTAFVLHALFDADDANAVAAGAFHSINGHSHGIAPVSIISSSRSCGSATCSIMFVNGIVTSSK
jgi:hypothetical protein